MQTIVTHSALPTGTRHVFMTHEGRPHIACAWDGDILVKPIAPATAGLRERARILRRKWQGRLGDISRWELAVLADENEHEEPHAPTRDPDREDFHADG